VSEDNDEDDPPRPDFSKDPVLKNFWTKTTGCGICPGCGAKNYVSLGDMQDETAFSTDIVQCWQCKTKSWISSDVRDVAEDMYDSADGAICDEGKKEP
jgi:hypothetical protein